MRDLTKGCHPFADRICKALGIYTYLVVGQVFNINKGVTVIGRWVGDVPENVVSRAPHIAYGKFGELLLMDCGLDGTLVMTPVPGNEQSYGWMGGGAQLGLGIAVSKLAQEHDRLVALITLFNAIYQKLALHHVGYRYLTEEEYEVANGLYPDPMVRAASDHRRVYFRMPAGYYCEHQYFPEAEKPQSSMHWDFVCEDPEAFLLFIAHAYGVEPVFFDDAGPNDPIGVVWIVAKDGTKIGVMARKTWWEVEAG